MRRLLVLSLLVAACADEHRGLVVPAISVAPGHESVTHREEPAAPLVVDEDGVPTVTETEPPAPVDTRPRIGSVAHITWIFSEPSKGSRQIGYVREGTSVVILREGVGTTGCAPGWVEVAPYGYVCRDHTTRTTSDPLWRAQAFAAQDGSHVMPFRYALSMHAPMYARLPTLEEEEKVEGPRGARPAPAKLGYWARSHEELARDEPGGIEATDAVPEPVQDGRRLPSPWGENGRLVRKWIPAGSMLAFTHAFSHGGRVWLLSPAPELAVVPADRVRPFRTSGFRGLRLGGDTKLPLAWARHDGVPLWRRGEDGAFAPSGEVLPPRTSIPLGEAVAVVGKERFVATARAGLWVREGEVAVARARDTPPTGVAETDRWIEVKLRAGTLVAYEGKTPVYATLQSPGAGGVPAWNASNAVLVKNSTTPLGLYRITWKTRAAAMTPEAGDPKKFWLADVPYTQYFRPPFAIHTAYWHEDFGMPKSAGCVNVSPEDGRFLFDWTDVAVPAGWQGAGPGKQTGQGTFVAISP